MLTESEREWLEDRKHKAYCRYCNVSKLCANPFASGYSCPLTGNTKDAAEFSERVAEKLAINDTSYLPCHQKGHENQCPYGNYCPTDKKKTAWCKMKHARLAVEEEMYEAD